MAKYDDCPKRIYITLDDEAKNILVFQCKRLGMSKTQYICNLIRNSVDRQDVIEFLKR